ncbi:outer membrane protein assembly factor BamA [Thioflexithrix psekupsensis]|uniref:Outer membrane protein assembly factor BamA n=1 Tax=Thioflexithrix psekupsensis TaxID=1570016 RepID=A0A251XCL0_9GAMM|nr:outer membrane protein assembly factor BamA [Thioflexithrix psekupsensis]
MACFGAASRFTPSVRFGRWLGAALLLGLSGQNVTALESFVVEDIRLEGLRRNSPGTVFNYLPVNRGDKFDAELSVLAINRLFKSGLFRDIQLQRDGNVLVVVLDERPAISFIEFNGNKQLKTDDLRRALRGVGFAEGRVFDRSLLERVEQELQRQYFTLGRYGVSLQSTVTPLDRNRVAVQIDIREGEVARIQHINLVGNRAFDDDTLLSELNLTTGGWFTFLTNSDQYSRQKLAGDLETLRSYYLDRGYINYSIDSTQVSITPDKEHVYITINMTEGDQYRVNEIRLVGNLIAPEEELLGLMKVKSGDVFSRKSVTASTEAVTDRIGHEGYAFANVNPVPDIDPATKTINLSLFIDPGKRVYVRNINFSGNTRTRDEVLRREMRQMESAWISTQHVKRSQERLERLNYFDNVTVETQLVPNHNDLVDLNYRVVERPSGNLMAGVGFSQSQGLLFNASIQQDNFLGTGKRVGFAFNNSKVNTVYNLSYFNPFIDVDGVSRGYNLFYRTTDAEEANLSRYTMDIYGLGVNYGIPISEFNDVRLGGEYDHTELKTTSESAQEIFDFIRDNGESYHAYRLVAGWSRDTRNRSILPDSGVMQSFSARVALPLGDLKYYKVSYRHQWLYPLTENYTLSLDGEVAYGDGYGSTHSLPFFENYTAGGPRSVRGYEDNTLGPRDSRGRPFGGNFKMVGNAEIILPVPFAENAKSFRLSAFVDVGNVYASIDDFEASDLRYTAGLAALWVSPLGMLTFSLAKPLNKKPGDETQAFQFSIGTTF